MAHEITSTDSLFSVRYAPWHGLGEVIENAPTSEDALRIAGLDWEVIQQPLYTKADDQWFSVTEPGVPVEDYRANLRGDNGTVLGVVSNGYKVVQNREAFAFSDALIRSGDVRYETAGSLRGGKKVWMLGRMDSRKILGDETVPYLLITNGHDGRNAVRCCLTPVRVVCANTLNLALTTAVRSWSTNHQGDIHSKLQEAERALELSVTYMSKLEEEASRLADLKVTNEMLAMLTVGLFPLPKDQKRQSLVYDMRTEFLARHKMATDLDRFRGTGWGFIGAVSDFAGHREPRRSSAATAPRRFESIANGHPLLDKALGLLEKVA